MRYLWDRLREPSTWAGLAGLIPSIVHVYAAPTDPTGWATLLPSLVAVVKADHPKVD